MRYTIILWIIAALFTSQLVVAQSATMGSPRTQQRVPDPFEDMHPEAPDAWLQQAEKIRLKKAVEDRKKAITLDADRLSALLQELKLELAKTDAQQVMSVDQLKKADEIEKLAKHLKRDLRDPI